MNVVVVAAGLGNALIQKKDADDIDFSSVFWFNCIWCIVLYFLLFVSAPLIASFYKKELLTPIIRVVGLQLIVSGIKNVQIAYVSRTMQFKLFFYATLIGTICAAAVGIAMAYKGFGVWALVTQHLVNTVIDTFVLWLIVGWKPKFVFSVQRVKNLFSYGWKLLSSVLLNTVFEQLHQLII